MTSWSLKLFNSECLNIEVCILSNEKIPKYFEYIETDLNFLSFSRKFYLS